jgi:RNA polymerase sigma factor (sigma-70 family)
MLTPATPSLTNGNMTLDALALALQKAEQNLKGHSPKPLLPFTASSRQWHQERRTLFAERTHYLTNLYAQLNPQVKRYLQAQNWKFNEMFTTEDLCNQVWLYLLERIADFDPNRGRFATWFYTYVVIGVLNRARRTSQRQQTQQSTIELDNLEDPRSVSVLEGFSAECQQKLKQSVETMPERWKVIILGLYFCEQPKKQKDLASDMGITPAAVNQNKGKALAHLRTILSAAGCQP